jgi:hypothetical protein
MTSGKAQGFVIVVYTLPVAKNAEYGSRMANSRVPLFYAPVSVLGYLIGCVPYTFADVSPNAP